MLGEGREGEARGTSIWREHPGTESLPRIIISLSLLRGRGMCVHNVESILPRVGHVSSIHTDGLGVQNMKKTAA